MNKKQHFVLAHIAGNPLAFIGIICMGFINSCSSFLLPVSIGEFFSLHFKTGSSKGKLLGWLGIHLNTMEEFLLLFVLLLFTKVIVAYIESLATFWQGELFVKDLREKIFTAQMDWPPAELTQKSYGKYLLRYSNDMKAVQNYFTKGVLEAIVNIIFLCTGLFILSRIHVLLTGIFIMLLLLALAAIYLMARLQKPFIMASRSYRSSLLSFVARSLSGFDKIKMRKNENVKIDDFKARSNNLYQANMKSNKMESLIQSMTPFLIFGMIGILLWQMTMPYIRLTAADGLMIMLMILMMQGSLRKIMQVPGYLNKGRISLEKIEKLLDQNNLKISNDTTQSGQSTNAEERLIT